MRIISLSSCCIISSYSFVKSAFEIPNSFVSKEEKTHVSNFSFLTFKLFLNNKCNNFFYNLFRHI